MPGSKRVDLDLQAIVVDARGHIVDAIYHNNQLAMRGAIQGSGDETSGDKHGLDEAIWVRLHKLPPDVQLIIFVVAAFSGGGLHNADQACLQICENVVFRVVKQIRLDQRSVAEIDMVALMKRSYDGSWSLIELDEPPSQGNHFLDILEPCIGNVIRHHIRGAPEEQKVSFLMDKGGVVDLPKNAITRRLAIGIGGTLQRHATYVVDIDISAVFFSGEGKVLGAVDPETSDMYGFRHSGDSVVGASVLDDEWISADMLQIPELVCQIFFLMTVKEGTFQDVQSAYARIVDHDCTELACYCFEGGIKEQGLVVARIFRGPSRHWGFEAIGAFCKGNSWTEALPDLKGLFARRPQQKRGNGQLLTRQPKRASVSSDSSTRNVAMGVSPGSPAAAASSSASSNLSAGEAEPVRTDDHPGCCEEGWSPQRQSTRCRTVIMSEFQLIAEESHGDDDIVRLASLTRSEASGHRAATRHRTLTLVPRKRSQVSMGRSGLLHRSSESLVEEQALEINDATDTREPLRCSTQCLFCAA